MKCECGFELNIGDSCHECRQLVPGSFYDYYLSLLEGLHSFQMWHTPIDTEIVREVVNVIQGINEAETVFDILASVAMANHLAHYNGLLLTDYLNMPYQMIDKLSNGFDGIWSDVEADAAEILEAEWRKVRIRRPWQKMFNSPA